MNMLSLGREETTMTIHFERTARKVYFSGDALGPPGLEGMHAVRPALDMLRKL